MFYVSKIKKHDEFFLSISMKTELFTLINRFTSQIWKPLELHKICAHDYGFLSSWSYWLSHPLTLNSIHLLSLTLCVCVSFCCFFFFFCSIIYMHAHTHHKEWLASICSCLAVLALQSFIIMEFSSKFNYKLAIKWRCVQNSNSNNKLVKRKRTHGRTHTHHQPIDTF